MTSRDLIELSARARRRCHLVGSEEAGVVIGLDLEGRLYAILAGQVLNRVNPEAFLGTSTAARYLNPGGDGLWPAPEGSRLGYEYSTGSWRVPPGLTNARFVVLEATSTRAVVRAEIDLINAQGLGIPTAFERHVEVMVEPGGLVVDVKEVIEYLGAQAHPRETLELAPWSLCQFDCGPGCEARYPAATDLPDIAWDLYAPSTARRACRDGVWHVQTVGSEPRFQIGLAPAVDYVEFVDPRRGITVHRTSAPLPAGWSHVDIADRPPQHEPDGPPVRFSIYSDPSGFMEIEAAGGCPHHLAPGCRLEVAVRTAYRLA